MLAVFEISRRDRMDVQSKRRIVRAIDGTAYSLETTKK